MTKTEIPEHLVRAISDMIAPYGFDFAALLAKQDATPRKASISIAEAVELTGIKPWTLWRLVRSGKVQSYKLGDSRNSTVTVDTKSLESFLASRKRGRQRNSR
jgi:hypothetical protein